MGLRAYEGYADTVFDQGKLKAAAELVWKLLKQTGHTKTPLVVTGKSGIAMGFALNALYGVNLVVVRKANEQSHGGAVEGNCRVDDYIVLDDFVDSGETIRKTVERMNLWAEQQGAYKLKCVGFIEYTRLFYVKDYHTASGKPEVRVGPGSYAHSWVDRLPNIAQ